MVDDYRKIFEILRVMEPENYDLNIVLTEYDCDCKDESEIRTYVDVSGMKKEKDLNSISDSYAIEFVEWKKWLGMDIAPETIKEFTELEIITHCLYEMTFIDYEEKEIKKQLEQLNNTVEEYKKLPEDEKQRNTITIEELKQKLNNKGSN